MVKVPPHLKTTAKGIDSSIAVSGRLQGPVQSGDSIEGTSGNGPVLLVRQADGGRVSQQLFHARIDLVFQPRQKPESPDWFIRAEVVGNSDSKRIIVPADAVRQHFYPGLAYDGRESLYKVLSVDENATLAGLRLAWRVRTVAARLSETRLFTFNGIRLPDPNPNMSVDEV
jgi:hypothetical protein